VRQLTIDVSGSGRVELDPLPAERASVTITGSGNVVIAASQALDVHTSGSGPSPTVATRRSRRTSPARAAKR
jgi:hypothetical protein